MRVKNAVAAARQGVTIKTLGRWDKRFDEVGYPKPIYILGQIHRDLDEIIAWEALNLHTGIGTRRRAAALANLAKPRKPKQAKPTKAKRRKVKDKAEAQRAEARRDPRQQGLPGIGGPK